MNTYLIRASAEDILDFILMFQKAYPGVSPSYREIMQAFDINSTGTVASRIEQLEKEGELETYREFAGFRGLICEDTVLLERNQVEALGLDWNVLLKIRDSNRAKVKRILQNGD